MILKDPSTSWLIHLSKSRADIWKPNLTEHLQLSIVPGYPKQVWLQYCSNTVADAGHVSSLHLPLGVAEEIYLGLRPAEWYSAHIECALMMVGPQSP